MDEFKKFDVNGDGAIDKAEWDALEYEDVGESSGWGSYHFSLKEIQDHQ